MELRLKRPAFWASLHLRSGLHDWDMAGEVGLGTTTTDQGPLQVPEEASWPPAPVALKGGRNLEPLKGEEEEEKEKAATLVPSSPPATETEVQPHLWMWVNPSEVCPIPGRVSSVVAPPFLPGLFPPDGPLPPPATLADVREGPLRLSTAEKAEKVPRGRGSSGGDPGVPQKVEGFHGPTPTPQKPKGLRSRSRRLKRAQGGWPRPPLNYCILISLALHSSVDSSLTVQEIYQFTRQHFPFFRTAPEGWKNTVRHNLCFSSSFEKTTDFVCLEGNRKSRLWKLTTEGRRKFQEETQALPEDTMGLVHQSMDRPELMKSLFGL